MALIGVNGSSLLPDSLAVAIGRIAVRRCGLLFQTK